MWIQAQSGPTVLGAGRRRRCANTRPSNSVSSSSSAASHVPQAASTARPYFDTAPCDSESARPIERVVIWFERSWISCFNRLTEILGLGIGGASFVGG